MTELKNVTVVSINCVNVRMAITAVKYSMRNIKFFKSKIFTSEEIPIDLDVDGIEFIKIPKLNYEEYNRFIVYNLFSHIESDYVLIVQDDGYVINPHKWTEDFLKYDYIGAPWALPPVTDKVGYRDIFGNIIRVGNGGFSLRSRNLLSLPTKLDLEWKPYFGFYNEDGFFTCHNRHIFEQEGCLFAPLDVAVKFSHETSIPETEGIEPFGFHGKWSKYVNLAYV